ncbi:glycosyltransferase family 39 protein [bacterium]|nr:glycosyltransferase family 39 protein [bacterium]
MDKSDRKIIFKCDRNSLLFFLISTVNAFVLSYFIYMETSKYGVGIVMVYPQIAQKIVNEGLASILTSRQVAFAPLYQFLLAFLSKIFNFEVIESARYFNIFLVACSFLLASTLFRKLTKSWILLLVFEFSIVFSAPINFVFSYANSEPLFIIIIIIITFSVEKTSYNRLVLSGFLTSLAILTRYAGVAIVPSVCLYIFIQKSGLSEKIKKCFCYATIPSLTYILYLTRNYYFTGTLMGERTSSIAGFLSNTDRAVFSVSSWFSGSYFFLILVFFTILGAIIWNYRTELFHFYTNTSGTVKFSFCFVIVYSLFIIISCTTTALEPLGSRFMSPLFISLLLVLLSFVVFIFQQHIEKTLILAFVFIFCICLILSFYKTIKDINFRKNDGAGDCTTTFWHENKLLNFAANNIDKNANIWVNNCLCTQIILKEHKNISYIPWKRKDSLSNESTGNTLDNLAQNYQLEKSFIIWYKSRSIVDPDVTFSINELQSICKIDEVMATDEGILYEVKKCITNDAK